MERITCVAPVNIAVIKYWGKRNEALILPLNDSISTTLSTQDLCAKTSIMASPEFACDRIWLNGREESFDNPRIKNCLSEMRRLAAHKCKTNLEKLAWHIHVCSENNFPTAAGLASSAAGYACLVFTLAQLYGITDDISAAARMGSGSACRSVFGGFVRWHKGSSESGSDSIATQIAPASHWPELRILILVVCDDKKKTSSTIGMQKSVETSLLLRHRAEKIVPMRTEAMQKAIMEKNFPVFAEITMKESNQFHAVCLDTYPPAVYMNETSHAIANFVHKYNFVHNETKLAYTFDAGCNACLYMMASEVPAVLGLIDWVFPSKYECGNELLGKPVERMSPNEVLITTMNTKQESPGSLQYLILSNVGEGPQILEGKSVHLLDEFGKPVKTI